MRDSSNWVRILIKSFSKEIEKAKISKSERGFWDSNEKRGVWVV